MAIDPSDVCLFYPHGCGTAKGELYKRVARSVGYVTREKNDLADLPDRIIPVIGCTPALRLLVECWQRTGRNFIYWDAGYVRRQWTAWLPRGERQPYYRWHLNSFQMRRVRPAPGDRFANLKIEVKPWREGGDRIVVAPSLQDYDRLHGCEGWVEATVARLQEITTRPVFVRHRDSDVPLDVELQDAHCLVTHGSNAANEAVIMGCPVFVLGDCAAALVGKRDLEDIDRPIRPDREAWLHSLAYSQFTEMEIRDGSAWQWIA